MSSPPPPNPTEPAGITYRFGQFELRSRSGELRRKGQLLRLPEQPLQILLALLESPGEVVSREALRDRLWPQNTFVDFEIGLNAAMKRLRRALLDDAANPRFIETLPRRGYRLLVPVSTEQEAEESSPGKFAKPSESEQAEPEAAQPEAGPAWKISAAWLAASIVAAGFLIAAGLFLSGLRKPASLRAVRRYNIVLPDNAPQAPTSLMPLGVGRPNLAISRDGERIVYAGIVGTTPQLFLRTNAGAPARALPGTEGANSPFFSPDGQWVGFFAESKLKKIRLDGGPAVTLCDVVLGFGGSWAEDGYIYFTPGERSAIYRIAASGGVPAQVTTLPALQRFIAYYWPQVLPGGKGILFGNSRAGIGVFNSQTGKSESLTSSGSSPRWSPSGHILYVDESVLWALPFDLGTLKKNGAPIVVVDHVRMEQQGAAQFDISRDDTLIYAAGGDLGDASLVWVDGAGTARDIGLPLKRYGEFRLSPDGKTLAVVISDGLNSDLWAFDLQRKVLTRLTDEGPVRAPIWSPDGKTIVYVSISSGKQHLAELSIGGLQKRVIAFLPGIAVPTGFTPDGRMIAASGVEPAGHTMYLVDVKSGEKHVLESSPYISVFPTVSPDGHWLAYVSDETGRWEIYIRALSKSALRWRISTDGGEEPIWDRSGHRLFFRNGDKWMRVELSTGPAFKASEPVQILAGPYVNIPGYSYDVAADGRFLLLKSEYQDKRTSALEVIENWPALPGRAGSEAR